MAFSIKHSSLWQPNPTECKSVIGADKREYVKVQEMRRSVLQLTRTERGTSTQKRVIFSLVGHVAHSLFGMLDSNSEAFYKQKNSRLEEQQFDRLQLIREQTIVVRSILKSSIQVLHDVPTNELILIRELHQILKFINVENKKIENKLRLLLYR